MIGNIIGHSPKIIGNSNLVGAVQNQHAIKGNVVVN